MALIFDKVLTFFSGMNAVALSPGGDLAAVCFHDRELYVYRIVEPPRTSERKNAARDARGSLEEYRFLRLAQGRYNRPPEAEVHYRYTKLAFLDNDTLLVAREIEQVGGGWRPQEEPANISLAAIRVGTGELVREFTAAEHGPTLAAPLLIPPMYVLFPAGERAIGLDATSFRELFRLDYGGGQLGQNAMAYDSATGRLYALAGEFESSSLHTYLLRPDRGSFEELQKRRLDLDGFLGTACAYGPTAEKSPSGSRQRKTSSGAARRRIACTPGKRACWAGSVSSRKRGIDTWTSTHRLIATGGVRATSRSRPFSATGRTEQRRRHRLALATGSMSSTPRSRSIWMTTRL